MQCKAWFNLEDVGQMYDKLGGSPSKKRAFLGKAKKLAVRSSGVGAYIFKREDALFELFQRELATQIENKKIRYFGELVQLIS